MFRRACRIPHFQFCAVFSTDPPFSEHGWHFQSSIEVNSAKSPNMATGAGKHVPFDFSLSRPSEQSAMLDFQVARCLTASEPRCYGLIVHKIGPAERFWPCC